MNILEFLFGFPVSGCDVQQGIPYILVFTGCKREFAPFAEISGEQQLSLDCRDALLTISGAGGNTVDLSCLLYIPPTCYSAPLTLDGTTLYTNEGTTCESSVDLSSLAGGTTIADIISDLTVGSITAGDTVPAGTTLQQFIEMLLLTTFYPTFTNPTFAMANTAGASNEIGSVINFQISYLYGTGQILGNMVLGTWVPLAVQGPRGGTVVNYTLNSINTAGTNYLAIVGYTVLANNVFPGDVLLNLGQQPLDSAGAPYLAGYPAGAHPLTTSFAGVQPYFRGKSAGVPVAGSALLVGSNKVVASSAGTISITYAASSEYLWFAIPASSTTKAHWYVDAINNGNIGAAPGDLFNAETIVSVDSPTALWNGVNYKFYISDYQTSTAGAMQMQN